MTYQDEELKGLRRSLDTHDLPDEQLKQRVEDALYGLKNPFEQTGRGI